MTDEQKIRAYELALQTILFKCHRRFMFKDPKKVEEYWEPVMQNPIELVWLLESVGSIAKAALEDGDDKKDAA